MFNFGNIKQYYVAPTQLPIGDSNSGGGGTTGSSLPSFWVSPPGNSYADYNDLALKQLLSFQVSSTSLYYIDYTMNIKDNVTVNTEIGTNGLALPSGTQHSWVNNGSFTGALTFYRYSGSPGKQHDTVVWVDNSNGTSNIAFDYVTLQLAIPVTQYTISGSTSILSPNSSTNITFGQTVTLSKALNRGDEKVSNWKILKSDPAGSFNNIEATQGVDYQFTSGNLESDDVIIDFLNGSFNYSVQNIVEGYNFASNPYNAFPNEIGTNTSVSTHNFILTASSVTYDILIPQIDISYSSGLLTGTDFTVDTCYQNSSVVISPSINIASGHWIKKGVGSDETIIKSSEEWSDYISTNCNITLEVREKTSNTLVVSRNGLNDVSIKIPTISTYTLKYITQLK